jgi:hypothetical protein
VKTDTVEGALGLGQLVRAEGIRYVRVVKWSKQGVRDACVRERVVSGSTRGGMTTDGE